MHILLNEWYDNECNSSYQNKKHQSHKIHVCIKDSGSLTENAIHRLQIKISVLQLTEIIRKYV